MTPLSVRRFGSPFFRPGAAADRRPTPARGATEAVPRTSSATSPSTRWRDTSPATIPVKLCRCTRGQHEGGMTHLAAAAQVPRLPQMILVPVRLRDNRPNAPTVP
jgi:hypothetical protein